MNVSKPRRKQPAAKKGKIAAPKKKKSTKPLSRPDSPIRPSSTKKKQFENAEMDSDLDEGFDDDRSEMGMMQSS